LYLFIFYSLKEKKEKKEYRNKTLSYKEIQTHLLKKISQTDDYQSEKLKNLIIETIAITNVNKKIENLIKFKEYKGYFERNLGFEKLENDLLNKLGTFLPNGAGMLPFRFLKAKYYQYLSKKIKADDLVNYFLIKESERHGPVLFIEYECCAVEEFFVFEGVDF
jgi:hypothetical protein